MAISRRERHRNASAAGYKGFGAAAAASPGGSPSLPRSASAEFAQVAATRRATPGPTGRCRAARGTGAGGARRLPCAPAHPAPPEQGRRVARSRAGPRRTAPCRSRSRHHWTLVRRTEPRSDVDQGEEAEGPQLPGVGPRPGHPTPAQARAFLFSGPLPRSTAPPGLSAGSGAS